MIHRVPQFKTRTPKRFSAGSTVGKCRKKIIKTGSLDFGPVVGVGRFPRQG